MARSSQSIVSAYSNVSIPSNPFTQVNLAPNKTEGVTSYDNAEMVQTLSEVYTYAQQEASILMPLFDQRDMTALFHDQDTFNKVQFVQKTEEAPYTPLYVPSGGTRSYTLLAYHQGIQISPTIENVRRYSLMPKAQMELAKALGRLYDLGILWAISQSVLTKSSVSAATFQGIPSVSVTSFPDSNIYLHAGSSGTGAAVLNQDFFDNMLEIIENRDLDPANCWVIGGPELRRALRGIDVLRDKDNTRALMGPEQSRYLRWNDLNFAFLGPETKPVTSLIGAKKFSSGGGFVNAGGSAESGVNGLAFIVDWSAIQWGPAPFATRAMSSFRDDLSYTMQFYSEVGFGGMRIDDSKVIAVKYKRQ